MSAIAIGELFEFLQNWELATKLAEIPNIESRLDNREKRQVIVGLGPDLEHIKMMNSHFRDHDVHVDVGARDMNFAVIRPEVRSIRVILYEDKLGHINLQDILALQKWEMIQVWYKNYPHKIHYIDDQFTHNRENRFDDQVGFRTFEFVVYSKEELLELLEIAVKLYRS